jgi:hypothetical protein
MLTGIDHVILAVPDLEVAAREVEQVLGLRVAAGGRHEVHGTHNRLVWLGDSYIELVGVFDEAVAGGSWWGRHALAVIERGGGYMGVALASDDVAAEPAVADPPEEGRRVRPDGREVRWRIRRPASIDADLGTAFLIEHDTAAAEWTPAERAARVGEVHPLGTPAALRRVELPVAQMHRATMRIHRELGVAFRPSLSGDGARDGAVGRQTLRLLRAAQGPRIVLAAGTRSRAEKLLGCDWLFEPA